MFTADHINSLEDYVCALGLSAVSLSTLFNMQNKAIQLNILQDDEVEQVETIKYQIKRAYHSIQSLLNLMEERADVNIKGVADKLQQKFIKQPNQLNHNN